MSLIDSEGYYYYHITKTQAYSYVHAYLSRRPCHNIAFRCNAPDLSFTESSGCQQKKKKKYASAASVFKLQHTSLSIVKIVSINTHSEAAEKHASALIDRFQADTRYYDVKPFLR